MEIKDVINAGSPIFAFAVSSDSRFLIVGAQNSISRWHIPTKAKAGEVRILFRVSRILLSEDNGILYVGEENTPGRMFAFDAISLELINELYRHNSPVTALLVLHSFDLLVSGAHRELIPRSLRGKSPRKLQIGDGTITALVATDNEKKFFAGFSTGRVFQIASATLRYEEILLEGAGIESLCLFDEGRKMAVGNTDCAIRFFDLATQTLLSAILDRPQIPNSLSFDAEENHVIVGYPGGRIEVYDRDLRRLIAKVDVSTQGRSQLEYVDDVGLLLACESGKMLVCSVPEKFLGTSRRRSSLASQADASESLLTTQR